MNTPGKIDYYKVFYVVAKESNMAKASEALAVTPSTVTKGIHALELSLGCQLFIRTTKGVRLTTEGKALYKWVEPAIQLLDSGEHELQSLQTLDAGTLNIGTVNDLMPNALTKVWMRNFCKKYPGISLHFTGISAQDIESALDSATVDIVLGGRANVSTDNLNAIPIFRTKDIAIVGRDLAHLTKHPISLEELAQYPLIFTGDKRSNAWATYEEQYAKHGLLFKPHILTPMVGMQINAVRAGLGYSFIPESSYGSSAKYRDILKVEISDIELAENNLVFYATKDYPLSKAAKTFIDIVLESVDECPHTLTGQDPFYEQPL